jgi:L-fuconolactonase
MRTAITVDAHLHVWEMPSETYPWSPLRDMRPAEAAPVEVLLATMKRNGVDKAIIVQPSNYGYDHRYVSGCLAGHPDRFAGVALLDFRAGSAPERVNALYEQGYRGVRLFMYQEADLAWVSPAIDPVMKEIAALNMIVTVFGPWQEMDRIRRLAHRWPTVRFVIDHLGHPQVDLETTWLPILQLAEVPTIHIKVSDFPTLSKQPYPFANVFPFVQQACRAFGAGRMMWASNFPGSLTGSHKRATYGQLLGLIDLALPNLAPGDRERIMGGTAAEMWNLDTA